MENNQREVAETTVSDPLTSSSISPSRVWVVTPSPFLALTLRHSPDAPFDIAPTSAEKIFSGSGLFKAKAAKIYYPVHFTRPTSVFWRASFCGKPFLAYSVW
ncbi:hypothetical protein K1719_010427 [Acacia pycnantha]|nr:hypothetical protein K1719_010427 [Acacia pycnantha]